MFAHDPTATGRGDGGHRGVRPAPLGEAQPQRRPTWSTIAGAAADGRRRGGHARQHRAGHGRSTSRPAPTAARAAGGGGLSGPAIHPVAVRAVYDVHAGPARPARSSASAAWRRVDDAVELLLAGASAVQVGTATFADPRAVPAGRWTSWTTGAGATGSAAVAELIGAAHGDDAR